MIKQSEYVGSYNIHSEWFEAPHNNSYKVYINGKCDKRTRNVKPWIFVLSEKRNKLLVYDSDIVILEKDTYYCWLHAMVPFIACEGDKFIVRLMTDIPKKYDCSIVHTEIENDNPLIEWVEDER